MSTPTDPDDRDAAEGGSAGTPEKTDRPGQGLDAPTTTVRSTGGDPTADAGGTDATAGGPPPPWQRGAPRSGPFPSPVSRGGPVPGPAGGRGPEQVPPRPGGPDGSERSATALIDAPTNQLSPEQLGMRAREADADRPDPGEGEDAATRAARGSRARRASLQVRRFDPWSVLKLALVLGVALFFVWMFAVGVLYAVLDGMGVWAQLNGTYQDLTADAGGGGGDLITAGGVFGVAAVVGVVNTILFTALASVSAFIYNISADVAGGIEVTLSERD